MAFPEDKTTDAGVIADVARAAANIANRLVGSSDEREFVLLRDLAGGERLQEVPSTLPGMVRPKRIVQAVTLETEASLIAYAKAFKDAGAMLFASIERDTIVAYLDYHANGEKIEAGFLGHYATLKLPGSLEWQAWASADGKLMPQLEFVRFLEENREDIRSPDAATILEACRDLQALKKVDFRSVVREDSDNYKIDYANEAEARSKSSSVSLPAEFVLSIPVYFDGAEVSVSALLRWKISDEGGLTLGFKLKRAERIRQSVFKSIVADMAEQTGIAAVYGRLG